MERLSEWNQRSLTLMVLMVSLFLVAPAGARAGTRFIPPPPPRHANDTSVDGIRQESEWGVYPAITSGSSDRFEALRDDEGEEIDFNRGTLSRKRVGNRAPAGLEVTGSAKKAAEENAGWKSSPTDDHRFGAPLQAPATKRAVAALRRELRRVDLPDAIGVDDRYVRLGADG